MEAVFYVRSVPKLYNEDKLPLRESPEMAEMAVRRAGSWCEMAASPKVEERPLLEAATKQRIEDRE
jgi:hypothetical protein